MNLRLRFLGGAGTVTGSKFLLLHGHGRTEGRTLVDCGLFQGLKEHRLLNWAAFPEDPKRIDQVIVTHAHLDHCGSLPLLVRQGFRGPILCSAPTRDLMRVVLLDSARIHEEDTEFANRKGFSRHSPALPLYTVEDAERAMERVVVVPARRWTDAENGLRFRLVPNGHLLGSVFVEVQVEGRTLVFSGDLGRERPLLLDPPDAPTQADHLVLESTYGDRRHPDGPVESPLRELVLEAARLGGPLIIPAFALGRSQELLFLLSELARRGEIPKLPVYLDSPMAQRAGEIFNRYPEWHRLSAREIDAMDDGAHLVHDRAESIAVMRASGPRIIIAGSGMATGGRVLHHLRAHLGDPMTTVALAGYQAAGTRGRALQDGVDRVKFHGSFVPVRAQIRRLTGLSAHADQAELLNWLRRIEDPPREVSIVHGEPPASAALAAAIVKEFGWSVSIPSHLAELPIAAPGNRPRSI